MARYTPRRHLDMNIINKHIFTDKYGVPRDESKYKDLPRDISSYSGKNGDTYVVPFVDDGGADPGEMTEPELEDMQTSMMVDEYMPDIDEVQEDRRQKLENIRANRDSNGIRLGSINANEDGDLSFSDLIRELTNATQRIRESGMPESISGDEIESLKEHDPEEWDRRERRAESENQWAREGGMENMTLSNSKLSNIAHYNSIMKGDYEGIKSAEERQKRRPDQVNSEGLFDDRLVNSMIENAVDDVVHDDKAVAQRKKLIDDYAEAKKAWRSGKVSGRVERTPETNDDDPEDHDDDYHESIKENQRKAFKGKHSEMGQLKRKIRDTRHDMNSADLNPSMHAYNNKKIADGMILNENAIAQKAMSDIQHFNDVRKATKKGLDEKNIGTSKTPGLAVNEYGVPTKRTSPIVFGPTKAGATFVPTFNQGTIKGRAEQLQTANVVNDSMHPMKGVDVEVTTRKRDPASEKINNESRTKSIAPAMENMDDQIDRAAFEREWAQRKRA